MAAGHEDTFHHVRDFPHFDLPLGIQLELPFGLTRFMFLQLVAGLIVLLVFRGLAKRIASGEPASGRWWNFWEALAVYIRNEVVRPTIGDGHHGHDDHAESESGDHHGALADSGSHPADRYLPFIWSCFFYVLVCNCLGAIPWLGAATGDINVTGALALATFGMVVLSGSRELGVVGFWKNLVPTMDLAPAMKLVMVPLIWVIELLGLLIKHGVLAVRLFANMMAGHTVVAVILTFIAMTAETDFFYLVLPASIVGQIAIGMLELFVAFLQAYIFAFLATLFIATAIHQH